MAKNVKGMKRNISELEEEIKTLSSYRPLQLENSTRVEKPRKQRATAPKRASKRAKPAQEQEDPNDFVTYDDDEEYDD